jgi:hypothetical protein
MHNYTFIIHTHGATPSQFCAKVASDVVSQMITVPFGISAGNGVVLGFQ